MLKVILLVSLLLVLGSWVFVGNDFAIGAAVGALIANLNWLSIRWATLKITQQMSKQKGLAIFVLVIKLGLMIVLCWGLLTRFQIDPLGFAVGMSALVIGILFGAGQLTKDMENAATSKGE